MAKDYDKKWQLHVGVEITLVVILNFATRDFSLGILSLRVISSTALNCISGDWYQFGALKKINPG
jgi:hypothetical protein